MPFELMPGRVIHTNDFGDVDAEITFNPPRGEEPFAITAANFKNKMSGARVQRTMMQMIMTSLRENMSTVLAAVIDRPYQFGGHTPEVGFDAGGLIQYLYNHLLGVSFPSDVSAQLRMVQSVTLEQAIPGDILVWGPVSLPTAAGVYLGGGKFVTVDILGGRVEIKTVSRNWLPDIIGSLR